MFTASGFTCCLYLSAVFGSGGDAGLFCKHFNLVLIKKNGETEGFCLVSFHLDVACRGAAAVSDSLLAGVDLSNAVASGCKKRGPRCEF